ncbi:TIGR04283 family arsenosugar biosynthesis glycosyltransferase [Desulfosporosinus sp.]|uniref:TIGR04283 family arsenosugar biosynthesis glycosyltransferase n=1 Tax=Desulfosporosinus sp. TaxID=157907 RepID=UPI002628B370|nr:TIGR04283 family arsenosugar biosynthesis glycosyltransferase [Desulfosporosinus sp.]
MSGIMPTKVSLIIPTLNEAETIGRLIQSLNGIPELEIIVSDGGSADGTVQQIIHSGVVAVQSKPGRGVQLNAGVQAASGNILLFVHADSLLVVSAIAQIRQAVIRGAQWGCCQLKFEEETRFFRVLAKTSNWRARYLSMCYGDQGIYCTRNFFDSVGGFPDWAFLEDLEFSRRARRRVKACVLKEQITTSTRRFRKHGLWRTFWKMQGVKVLFALGFPLPYIERFYRASGREKDVNGCHSHEQSSSAGQN